MIVDTWWCIKRGVLFAFRGVFISVDRRMRVRWYRFCSDGFGSGGTIVSFLQESRDYKGNVILNLCSILSFEHHFLSVLLVNLKIPLEIC